MPTIEQGKHFKAVQHKCVQGDAENPPGRRATVAIIPVDDHDCMRRMIELYFATTEERGSSVARVCTLFDSVNVLIGDFNVSDSVRARGAVQLKAENLL